MKQQQAGFTLIELIAVIVILGIISAVAVPRFVDLSAAAEEASVEGVAGSLASASSLNYAAYVAENAGLDDAPEAAAIDSCEDVAYLLEGGELPDNYAIDTSGSAITAGETASCGISIADSGGDYDSSNASSSFTAYGTDGVDPTTL